MIAGRRNGRSTRYPPARRALGSRSIISSTMPRWTRPWTISIYCGQVGKSRQVCRCREPLPRSAPSGLVKLHGLSRLPPTIHRMAGSRRRRSASFTSSYPRGDQTPTDAANRPMHGGRSCPCARRRVSRLPPRSAQARGEFLARFFPFVNHCFNQLSYCNCLIISGPNWHRMIECYPQLIHKSRGCLAGGWRSRENPENT